MYRTYFNLEENPFTTSPDPRFFHLAPSHAESVAKCEYAIRNKSGLAVVYGDVGTGKTTILNKLRERFSDEGFTIAVMNNPNQTSERQDFGHGRTRKNTDRLLLFHPCASVLIRVRLPSSV